MVIELVIIGKNLYVLSYVAEIYILEYVDLYLHIMDKKWEI